MLGGKPLEFWLAIVAASGFLIQKHKDKPLVERSIIAGSSGAAAISMSKSVAAMVGWPDEVIAFLMTATIYIVVDIAISIISDKDAMIEIIKSKLGVKK